MQDSLKSVCVLVNGCPENRNDGQRLIKFFKKNNYTIQPDYREADIICFRPCGGFSSTESDSLTIINTIKSKMKPSGELILCGCLPKINMEIAKEIHEGLMIGPEDYEFFDTKFMKNTSIMDVYANDLTPNLMPYHLISPSQKLSTKTLTMIRRFKNMLIKPSKPIKQESNYQPDIKFCIKGSYYIKISTGCTNSCSYCAIKKARGRIQSKSTKKIIRELDEGIKKGFNQIALLGTETSSYGKDIGTDFVNLLNTITDKEGDFKLRIKNFNPIFLIERFPEIKKILKSRKIGLIFSAIQSGNNRILKLMNRRYKVEDIVQIFKVIKNEFPDVLLATQFIVGFPTETDKEFRETLRLAQKLKLDRIECYRFESRPGTKASRMEGHIPIEVINERFVELKNVVKI